MQEDFSPNFISLQEASKISGYHQDYLSQLIRQGKIKGTKIGRNWFVVEEEIKNLSSFQKKTIPPQRMVSRKLIFVVLILVILIGSVFIFQKVIAPKPSNNFQNIPKLIENEQTLF